MDHYDTDIPESSRPNKTALKRAAKEVETLAEKLAATSDEALAGLELSVELRRELDLVRRAKGRSALRRQIKHLAGVLRQRPEEAAAVRAHLERRSAQHWEQQHLFHQLEAWRDRLCTPEEAPAALEALQEHAPQLDLGALGRLSRAACNGDRSAARQIFRRLRQAGALR